MGKMTTHFLQWPPPAAKNAILMAATVLPHREKRKALILAVRMNKMSLMFRLESEENERRLKITYNA